MIQKCTTDIENIEVKMFNGLLVDFVKESNAVAIVKGYAPFPTMNTNCRWRR